MQAGALPAPWRLQDQAVPLCHVFSCMLLGMSPGFRMPLQKVAPGLGLSDA